MAIILPQRIIFANAATIPAVPAPAPIQLTVLPVLQISIKMAVLVSQIVQLENMQILLI